MFDRIDHNDESGQAMAEYGVVLAVITAAVISTVGVLSGAIAARFGVITGFLNGIVG